MDFGATLLGYLVAGLLKPAVMIISAIIAARMARSYWPPADGETWLHIPKDLRPAFLVLFLSLVLFVFSELFCATETYVLMCSDTTWQILHSLSSGIGMGFCAVGLFMLLDRRLLHFGGGACVFRSLCTGCPQRDGRTCRLQSFLFLGGILVILVALPPLFASTADMIANTARFVLPFDAINSWYDHVLLPRILAACPHYHPIGDVVYLRAIPQQLDYRIYPIITIALTFTGLILLIARKQTASLQGLYLILFAAGLIGYTYYQLLLQRAVGDLLLAALGHEVGELFFLITLIKILKLFFPHPREEATA